MSVREAILAYTKGQSRHRIYIEEDIPLKKLEAARSKYVEGDDKIIVLVDDTVFGSGKDGICVGEEHLYVKQLLEKPKSFPIKSIRSLASKAKSFSSLEIHINDDLFVSLSQIDKEEHGYLMGILKAAQRGAKPPVEKSEPKSKSTRQPSSSPAAPTKNVAIMHCSECNATLLTAAKFCPECGTKVLSKGVCAACNSKFPKNAKFCPECGVKVGVITGEANADYFQENSALEIKNRNHKIFMENSVERISLIIGFIPEDWSGSSDGKVIIPGDPDHSKTNEITFIISDDGFLNQSSGEMISGDMGEIYTKISNETESISKGLFIVPFQAVKNIYEICLEEAEHIHSFIIFQEDDIDQFENKRKKFNGKFYFKYTVEDGDSIVTEKMIISKCNSAN